MKECPACIRPLRDSLCKLVPEHDRKECEDLFLKLQPKEFVDYLKSKGVKREDFLKALGK